MLAEVISHRPLLGRPGYHWGRGRRGHIHQGRSGRKARGQAVPLHPFLSYRPFQPSCPESRGHGAGMPGGPAASEVALLPALSTLNWDCCFSSIPRGLVTNSGAKTLKQPNKSH